MSVDSFRRVEEKYLLSEEKYDKLMMLLQNRIKKDKYFESTICNIYFDNDEFELVKKSISKPVYKQKVRLRSYNVPEIDSKVFLEIKKKYKGIVSKRRVHIPLSKMYKYLNGERILKNNLVMDEIDYVFKKYNLKPKIFIAYEREAYTSCENENFRITFDKNLRYRDDELKLELGSCGKRHFKDNTYIMEVKTLDSMPMWFCKILSKLEIYPKSFSKYGKIYTDHIIKSCRKDSKFKSNFKEIQNINNEIIKKERFLKVV